MKTPQNAITGGRRKIGVEGERTRRSVRRVINQNLPSNSVRNLRAKKNDKIAPTPTFRPIPSATFKFDPKEKGKHAKVFPQRSHFPLWLKILKDRYQLAKIEITQLAPEPEPEPEPVRIVEKSNPPPASEILEKDLYLLSLLLTSSKYNRHLNAIKGDFMTESQNLSDLNLENSRSTSNFTNFTDEVIRTIEKPSVRTETSKFNLYHHNENEESSILGGSELSRDSSPDYNLSSQNAKLHQIEIIEETDPKQKTIIRAIPKVTDDKSRPFCCQNIENCRKIAEIPELMDKWKEMIDMWRKLGFVDLVLPDDVIDVDEKSLSVANNYLKGSFADSNSSSMQIKDMSCGEIGANYSINTCGDSDYKNEDSASKSVDSDIEKCGNVLKIVEDTLEPNYQISNGTPSTNSGEKVKFAVPEITEKSEKSKIIPRTNNFLQVCNFHPRSVKINNWGKEGEKRIENVNENALNHARNSTAPVSTALSVEKRICVVGDDQKRTEVGNEGENHILSLGLKRSPSTDKFVPALRGHLVKKRSSYKDTITSTLRYNLHRKKKLYPVDFIEHLFIYKRPPFWNHSRKHESSDDF